MPVTISGLTMKGRSTAWVVSGVLFIPERSPTADVYAKVGVAELDESLEAQHFAIVVGGCVISACPRIDVESEVRQSDSRPYVGIGARFKVARAVGVRVEYEAIDRDPGDDTTMLSLGVALER